jgi:Flp pilus assembly protein TadD
LESLAPVGGGPSARDSESAAQEAMASVEALGWVVCARPRAGSLSAYAEQRRERKRRADLANRIGERRFGKGEYSGAISAFAEAITLCNEEALYFSNLAAALFAVQQVDDAWFRIREAIYLDPNHPTTRANYRMLASALGKLDEAERALSLFGSDLPS